MNKFYQIILLTLIAHGIKSEDNKRLTGEPLLKQIHTQLSLLHGSLLEEYYEQLMAALFISPSDKVLELGANVGRNTCVIAKILKKSKNLVALESDPNSVKLLTENRDHNKLSFKIEDSALSKISLIQSGWNTIPSEDVLPGYYKVKTITYSELKKKYKIKFNTLVADCEGALYYILRDEPNMLKDFKKVIVENDYADINHYNFVNSLLLANGFKVVYSQPLPVDINFPCKDFFYQAYVKAN